MQINSLPALIENIRHQIGLADLEKGIELLKEALQHKEWKKVPVDKLRELLDEQIALSYSVNQQIQEERRGMPPSEKERNGLIFRFLRVVEAVEKQVLFSQKESSSTDSPQADSLAAKYQALENWGNSLIKARPASKAQKAWHAYFRASQEAEPQRLEEVAKVVTAIIALTLGIFVLNPKAAYHLPLLEILALLSWFFALISSFGALVPLKYKAVKHSAESIEKTHKRIVKTKRKFLYAAVGLFLLGFGILICMYIYGILKG